MRFLGGFVQLLVYFVIILGEIKLYSEPGSCIVHYVCKEANTRG